MPQLLLELLSEEIPARMQAGAARDLARMAAERLKAQELAYESLETFVTPRRLTLVVEGLPSAQADRTEERKGPRANAPDQALQGFLRSTGLSREQLVERDGVLFASIARPGRPTPQIAAEIVHEIMASFPWPKSMRSGTSSFRWVRPLRSILFLFDGRIVPFDAAGLISGRTTRGHRFMGTHAGEPIEVGGFSQYREQLARQFVTLDAAERRATILERAQAVCAAQGLELVPDEGLADEVAGLVEHPVPLLGVMDAAFLDLPPEVIRTSMRTHQKYFAVRDPATGKLAPHFVVVANIEASDGGAEIARGNAKVLSARLSDARFFWDEDTKPGAIEGWLEKLKGVTFHAKLGTMAERVERIAALAREIAPLVGADPDLAETAARLAKADLASAMVGEFPELQGVMGGYYVRRAPFPHDGGRVGDGGDGPRALSRPSSIPGGASPSATILGVTPIPGPSPIEGEGRRQVADAVRDHYKPVGPSDSVPTAPVTVAVALADKLDTLVGFFAIDERPTGSKDPQALRRAALGFLRLALGSGIREHFWRLTDQALAFYERQGVASHDPAYADLSDITFNSADIAEGLKFGYWTLINLGEEHRIYIGNLLLGFMADRLKVQLRDEGKRHDLVDAVFALGDDDLVRIVDKVEALTAFLSTEDGANLLAGYRRGVNILKAEAKKNPGEAYDGAVDPARLSASEERDLHAALQHVQIELEPKLEREDFAGAMTSLSHLRGPVDAFFEKVLVNDPDPEVRLNRLRLLSTLRDQANRVADFALIQG